MKTPRRLFRRSHHQQRAELEKHIAAYRADPEHYNICLAGVILGLL